MPRQRRGYTAAVAISDAEFFIKFGKQGSTLGGLLDAVSISVSLGLQSGVGLETYASKYVDMRFEPMGLTDDPMVPTVASVLDYVFRRLALDFLDDEACARLGVPTLDGEARELIGVS